MPQTPPPSPESDPAPSPAPPPASPWRVLICDDEAPARDRIRQMLEGRTDFSIAGQCLNGRDAVESIGSLGPDVVFLDVQMPELDGFQVCEAVGVDRMPLIVFVTAYDAYALDAFEVHAVDYLLKPFDRERFDKALVRVRQRLEGRGIAPTRAPGPDLGALMAGLKARPRQDRLVFKSSGKVFLIKVADIHWVEADGNYVKIHAVTGSHTLRETLAWIEARLPQDNFMRISRSAVVNLDRIREIQPLFHGDHMVILSDGTKLTLSRNFRERLEALLAQE